MSAQSVPLISINYKPETYAWTMTIRKATFEGSFVETATALRVRYTILRAEVRGGGVRVISSREYYLTGRNIHHRLLTRFSIRVIKQRMRSVWNVIARRG